MENQTEQPTKNQMADIYIASGYGIMPLITSAETLQLIQDSQAERQRSKDEKRSRDKPPKPPKRPNASIGRIAFGRI